MSPPHANQVVVTGLGVISSIGVNIEEFLSSLKKGSSGIVLSGEDPVRPGSIHGPLLEFSLEEELVTYGHREPIGIQAGLQASHEALKSANLLGGNGKIRIGEENVGLIVGGCNAHSQYQFATHVDFEKNPNYINPKYALRFLDTHYVGVISQAFGISGGGFTIGGASASSNIAIIEAFKNIAWGRWDRCLVVGALSQLSPMELGAFRNIGALGAKSKTVLPEQACRPFDQLADGFIYGQAVGAVVLESREKARKRGVSTFARVKGTGLALAQNRFSDPSQGTEVEVMNRALQEANVAAKEVQYLNAHATSAPLGDQVEVAAIKEVFQKSLDRLWVNSTKSLTGHCLNSAGIIELIATILQMHYHFVHPNLNLDHPIDNECRFALGNSVESEIQIAMSNSFGFGGIHSSIIVGKED